jgi:hypothetical protein
LAVTSTLTGWSRVVVTVSSVATGAWLVTVRDPSARWTRPLQSTRSSSRYVPGKVPGGTVSPMVKPPFWVAAMVATAPVPWRASVPVRLQEPVLPSTSTVRPGAVDPGLTEEITGMAVTATVTVADEQAPWEATLTPTEPPQ